MSGTLLLALRLVLALALYTFLVWALLTIWRELKQQSELQAARQVAPIVLLRQDMEETESRQFASAEVLLGRDSACDCQVEDKTVSAEHARLSYHHSQWWIEDLQSRNGTYLNQAAVSAPVVVAFGDEIRLGQVIFLVQIAE